jgi:hypothetical protein
MRVAMSPTKPTWPAAGSKHSAQPIAMAVIKRKPRTMPETANRRKKLDPK